jgi:hypothetical protein
MRKTDQVITTCEICNKQLKDLQGLKVHVARSHSGTKLLTRRAEIVVGIDELKKWIETAKSHNFPSLSSFVRFYMREGISGSEQLRKEELEKQYAEKIGNIQNEKRKVEKELEAMKGFFVQELHHALEFLHILENDFQE